jgi:flagellar biosynthesis/type III secretory pathway protein FliH
MSTTNSNKKNVWYTETKLATEDQAALEQVFKKYLEPAEEEEMKKTIAQKKLEDSWDEGWEDGWEKGVAKGVSQGIAQGVNQGMAKGISQGVAQGVAQTTRAINMLRQKVDIEFISRSTGISITELIELRKECGF